MYRLVIYCAFIGVILFYSCSTKETRKYNVDEKYHLELSQYFDTIAKNRKGYLSIAALYKLDSGSNSFGKDSTNDLVLDIDQIPPQLGAILKFDADSLVFIPGEDVIFFKQSDSTQVSKHPIVLDENGWSETFFNERVSFLILTRNNTPYLRVVDPYNSAVDEFNGFERFEINTDFIFNGNFTYFDQPKKLQVPSIMGGEETTTFVGKASFVYQGKAFSFDVGKDGFVMLNDKTAGNQTYGGGRYFYLDLPEDDSEIVIDLNKMYNPPCAFSKYTVCLFAPKQNYLPFEVKAGEKYKGVY